MINKELVLEGYIECAIWSPQDNSGIPLELLPYTLTKDSVKRMKKDVECFLYLAKKYLGEASDDARIGHDFWLTRNHHGAGFWDGDYPLWGNRLTTISQVFPKCNITVFRQKLYCI